MRNQLKRSARLAVLVVATFVVVGVASASVTTSVGGAFAAGSAVQPSHFEMP
jgi:hypothetical protein